MILELLPGVWWAVSIILLPCRSWFRARCSDARVHFITTRMALEQAYWNQRQAAGSWTGASSVQPGLLHTENKQLPTSRLFINHALWSYYANLAHGSTDFVIQTVIYNRGARLCCWPRLHRRCRFQDCYMDGLSCLIISMYYVPAKLYNQRKEISHDVEMNNKGILHFIFF